MDVLEKSILDHPVFLFLLSRNYLESEVCQFELQKAVRYNRRIVIVEMDSGISENLYSKINDLRAESWRLDVGGHQLVKRINHLLSSERALLDGMSRLSLAANDWRNSGYATYA